VRETQIGEPQPHLKKDTLLQKKRAPAKESASGEEVLSDSSYDTDLAASSGASDDAWSDSDFDTEFDPDGEIVDEENEFDPPMFSYDVDDPCIDVNVVFPDVDQCKLAVTHFSVLHDHAFQTLQKDKTRFRAICKRANQGCKWTFFASTSPAKKYIGCKVNDFYYVASVLLLCCKCSSIMLQALLVTFLVFKCRSRLVDQNILVVHSTRVVAQWPPINGWPIEWLIW
jgi:hypothetical protein